MAFDQLMTQIEQQMRDVDLHGAGLATGATQGTGMGEMLRRLETEKHRRQHRANRTWVDPAVGMTTNV